MKTRIFSAGLIASAVLMMPFGSFTASAALIPSAASVYEGEESKNVPITEEKLLGDWHIYKVSDTASGEDIMASEGINADWIYTFKADGSIWIDHGSGSKYSLNWEIVNGKLRTDVGEELVYDGTDLKEEANGHLFCFCRTDGNISLGDLTGDGIIDAVDGARILRMYALSSTGKGKRTEQELAVADINKDGYINAVDASCILSYYAYTSTDGKNSLDEYMNRSGLSKT